MYRHGNKLHQNALTIGSVALVAVAVGAAAFLFSYDNALVGNKVQAVAVPFTKLTEGRQSVVARRVNYFITSAAQLSEIWDAVNAAGTPPKVDFKRQAVIAVFAGKESVSSIKVAKVEDANARMVSIAIEKPDCRPIPTPASPYEIVAVPTTSLPLTHTDIATIITCKK